MSNCFKCTSIIHINSNEIWIWLPNLWLFRQAKRHLIPLCYLFFANCDRISFLRNFSTFMGILELENRMNCKVRWFLFLLPMHHVRCGCCVFHPNKTVTLNHFLVDLNQTFVHKICINNGNDDCFYADNMAHTEAERCARDLLFKKSPL